MKQITFRFVPGRGYDHDVRLVKSLLADNWFIDSDSTVIEDVPDPVPDIVQVFEFRRKYYHGPIGSETIEQALSRSGMSARVSEVTETPQPISGWKRVTA